MRRINALFQLCVAVTITASLLMSVAVAVAQADSTGVPSLVISQLKITSSNGQFVTLYNPSNTTLDMSKYQLEYFNSYDLTKATSSRLIALSGSVPPHGYFVVNDSTLLLCYQLSVDSVSLGLSSTAGLVEVLAFNQSNPGSSVTPLLQDYVGWSKTVASGAQTLPTSTNAFLQRQPADGQNNPMVVAPGTGSWQAVQPDTANPCNLVSVGSGGTAVQTGMSQLLLGTEPPATIVGSVSNDAGASAVSLPIADVGLMAPQITELLPNPLGTGNDAADEFIELYNPNIVSFDLSSFSLQAGTSALHSFTFPSGTSLPAKGFIAFYSSDTGLSLSNSGGQAKLFDPLGNSISASGVYSSAKDGHAWALAKGAWYWTTSPTPGAANVIKQPPAAAKKSATKTSSKAKTSASKGKVKGAKTSKTSSPADSNINSDTASVTPVHPWTLALVAGLALLYGAYEYRADLANRIHQLRQHLKARRASRA